MDTLDALPASIELNNSRPEPTQPPDSQPADPTTLTAITIVPDIDSSGPPQFKAALLSCQATGNTSQRSKKSQLTLFARRLRAIADDLEKWTAETEPNLNFKVIEQYLQSGESFQDAMDCGERLDWIQNKDLLR